MTGPICVEHLEDLDELEELLLEKGVLLVEVPGHEGPVRFEVWVGGVNPPCSTPSPAPTRGWGKPLSRPSRL